MELSILTPSSGLVKDVDSVTAVDGSGSFGIMARHIDFISVLRPCVLVWMKGEDEGFIALDGGVMRVEDGRVTIASRESVEGEDYKALRERLVMQAAGRKEKEATFLDLLSNMEKLLVDRMVKFERGA